MLTSLSRAGGLPAGFGLRTGDEGRLRARYLPLPTALGYGHCGSVWSRREDSNPHVSPHHPRPTMDPHLLRIESAMPKGHPTDHTTWKANPVNCCLRPITGRSVVQYRIPGKGVMISPSCTTIQKK